jgi:hypothetical protein
MIFPDLDPAKSFVPDRIHSTDKNSFRLPCVKLFVFPKKYAVSLRRWSNFGHGFHVNAYSLYNGFVRLGDGCSM